MSTREKDLLDEDILKAFNDSDEWAETTLNSSGGAEEIETIQSTQQLIDTSLVVTDDPEPEHYEALRKYFGHREFKPMQWKIIRSILVNNRDNCAVMATGYGKSLCYQFPPVFTGGIALVISPLISLMQDQVLALTVANIPACYLGSANDKKNETIKDIFERKYNLVYLTPELCASDYGRDLLKQMSSKLNITLVAIDEAHCVSTWGNDFRHTYRHLGVLKLIFENTPTLALTATATEVVRRDIITSLRLKDPQVLCSGFDRPNLYFSACLKEKISVLQQLHPFMIFVDGKYKFDGPTIIYCITKKDTENFANILLSDKIDCAVYHAGISIKLRKEIHEKFVKDKISCIVATIAFGMGIDKPDVRTVIHWGASRSLESYYQEVGRAGRDGQPAKCHTFFNNADYAIHRFLRDKAQLPAQQKQTQENMAKKMMDYLDSINCRRKFILNHFQETLNVRTPNPNCCDNCTKKLSSSQPLYEGVNSEGKYDFTKDFYTFLSAVDFLNARFGLEKIVLFLKGSRSAKIAAYQKSPFFGSGQHKSDDWWRAISRLLEKESFIKKIQNDTGGVAVYFTIDCTKYGKKYVTNYNEDVSRCEALLEPIPEMIPLLKKKPSTSSITSGIYSSSYDINRPSTSRTAIKQETKILEKDIVEPKPKEKPAETPEHVLTLYRILLDKRTEIANELDIMPYVIASNEALMKMAEVAPRNIRSFREANLPGFTDSKIEKFAKKFMDKIISKLGPEVVKKVDDNSSIFNILRQHPLNKVSFGPSPQKSYGLFIEGMSVKEIADARNLVPGTVFSHLIEAMKQGYSIKLIELGVTEEMLLTIIKVMRTSPICNSTMLLTPIKQLCPENISINDVKAVVTYVQIREHLKSLGKPYSDFEDFSYKSLDNITNEEKSVEKVTEQKQGEEKNGKQEMKEFLSRNSALDYLLELADDGNFGNENKEDSDSTILNDEVINSFFEDSMELPSPKRKCNEEQSLPKKKCNEVVNFQDIFSAISTP